MKVSLVVPIYNSKCYIDRLLECCLKLSYDDFEIVFVDDCSTDMSEVYIKSILEDSELDYQYIFLDSNRGPGVARNIGVEKATGEYILFIDSDDWVRSDCLTLLVNKIEETNSDMVVFDYYRVWDVRKSIPFSELSFEQGEINKDLYTALTNDGVTRKLIKRDIIVNHNIKFPSWYNGEDIAFMLMYLVHVRKIYYLKENLYFYFQRTSSISNEKVQNQSFYIELFELYRSINSKSEYLSLRIIQDLIYNQTLLYLKVKKSKKFIKAYLTHIVDTHNVSLKKNELLYFDTTKKLFIKNAIEKKVVILKLMWFVKRSILRR